MAEIAVIFSSLFDFKFQELVDKSIDPELSERCPDIRWHFIGNCQSNKVSKLLKANNLKVVETLATQSLADKLQKGCEAKGISIGVMVQVSGLGTYLTIC